ncbi:MAG: cytochrome P450 [Bacteroidota bacterium]
MLQSSDEKQPNVNDRLYMQDPSSLYERLLRRGPFFNGTHWILSRHAHVSALLRNQAPSKRSGAEPLGNSLRKHILFRDPPDHTRHRAVVQEFFTPRSILNEEGMVSDIANNLIFRVKDKRRMEFMSEFATRLPVAIVASYLGVPEDKQEYLFKFARQYIFEFSNNPEVSDRGIAALRKYFTENIDGFIQKASPGKLLEKLAEGYREGLLSKEELIEMCVILFAAGGETSSCFLGSGLLTLLQHPESLEAVRNNAELMPNAIEEMLRYETPVPMTTMRVTPEAIEIDGLVIPEGQPIIGILAAANRDSEKFPNPGCFDIYRNTTGHFSFGGGIHYCIGASLARLEARVTFTTLLEQFPTLQLDKGNAFSKLARKLSGSSGGSTWHWRERVPTRGLEYLRLKW